MSHSHSESDTVPLHPSSQSDINEIKNQINASVQSSPAKPPSPTAPSSNLTSSTGPSLLFQARVPSAANNNGPINIAASGFGSPPNTLTEPVWDTVKRDLCRIVINLKPGKALRDWGLCGPFFFIVFLGPTLHLSRSLKFSLLHMLYLLMVLSF